MKSRIIILFFISNIFIVAFIQKIHPINATEANLDAQVIVFSAKNTSDLITSLNIDEEQINISKIITPGNFATLFPTIEDFNTTLKDADVFFVDRFLPNISSYLSLLVSFINGSKGNKGLVMFGILEGDLTATQVEIIDDILPVQLNLDYKNSSESEGKIQVTLTDSSIPEESQIVVEHIVWNSIPAVEEMTRVKVKNGANIILETALDQNSTLSEWNLADNGALNYTNSGYVMFFSFEILDGNLAIPLWPYFNYLIYISTFHVHPDVIDEQILSFALWPYSPIPHLIEIIMWFTMITFLWIISFIFYFRAKKTSRHYSEYYTNKSINIMEGNSDGK